MSKLDMMRNILLTFCLLLATCVGFSQADDHSGFTGSFGMNIELEDSAPIGYGFAIDYGVTPDITVGLYSGGMFEKFGYTDSKYRDFYFGFRGLYHFANMMGNSKFNPFVGLGMGADFESIKIAGITSPNTSEFMIGGFIGAQYYFESNLAVTTEFHLANEAMYWQLGLALKF